jgi:talin
VGEASHQVLSTIGHEDESSRELQDILLGLAKVVANTTAALVLKAKNIAATCDDQATQNKVIGAATQCALATSQLVACAKVRPPPAKLIIFCNCSFLCMFTNLVRAY